MLHGTLSKITPVIKTCSKTEDKKISIFSHKNKF